MKIKSPFGLRLWILLVTLCLVAGGTIYGLVFAWERIQQLEGKFNSSQMQSFQMASEVKRGLSSLNNSLLNYALVRDPEQWSQFEQVSNDLDFWIDSHDPSLNPHSLITTEDERQVFKELNRAYDDYVGSARAVHTNTLPALLTAGQLAQLDGFNAQAQRMRDLVRKLADAHRKAESAFFANSADALSRIRVILIAGVLFLLVLVGAMGWVIYRDTVAPLRTKLVQSQILLERQQKLATLGTLAAGIAHEIRNPLTSVKARLYTLEKRLVAVPAAKKDTEIISTEISRLERIVQEVLSFARPSEPHMKPLTASAFMQEIQGLMSSNMGGHDVQLLVESGPEVIFRADAGHLKQVLINLVRNAAEAIDGVGTVTLRWRAVRARLGGSPTDAVVLEVSDTGKGISPEAEKRLFDPFFSTKETGTGLGLSIAARIVERHAGILQYQTRPGGGTTFGVVLPREQKLEAIDVLEGKSN